MFQKVMDKLSGTSQGNTALYLWMTFSSFRVLPVIISKEGGIEKYARSLVWQLFLVFNVFGECSHALYCQVEAFALGPHIKCDIPEYFSPTLPPQSKIRYWFITDYLLGNLLPNSSIATSGRISNCFNNGSIVMKKPFIPLKVAYCPE
jgi:hypothetical protein